MKQFKNETEMLIELDNFIFKMKGLPNSELRNYLEYNIDKFLKEFHLDGDQHNFVDIDKFTKEKEEII